MQYTTAGADYQMEFDKIYSQQAAGINKIPEFQVRPSDFFQHFVIPLSAQLTVGEYSEPSGDGRAPRASRPGAATPTWSPGRPRPRSWGATSKAP